MKSKSEQLDEMSKAILITTDRIRYYKQQDKMLQSEIKRHGSPFEHDENRTNTFSVLVLFPVKLSYGIHPLRTAFFFVLCFAVHPVKRARIRRA